MKETVCSIVVTYNRKNLLIECLEALRKQTRPIDAIYLIDNASTDGTPQLLKEKGYISELPPENFKIPWEKECIISNLINGEVIKVHYVRMPENSGGAGGYYEGIKRGFENDYDWLWLMEDDVEAEKDCLVKLLKTFKEKRNALVVAPIKIYPDGSITGATLNFSLQNPFTRKIKYFKTNIENLGNLPENIEVHDVPFEGALIKNKAILFSGYPLKKFFINYDDLEFCIRIKKYGSIVLNTRAIIKKKTSLNYEKKTDSLKEYYAYRNLFWIDRIHGKNFFVRHLRPILYLLRALIKSVVKMKFKKLKLVLFGFCDSYICKLNKFD